jgi:hypothetical protein
MMAKNTAKNPGITIIDGGPDVIGAPQRGQGKVRSLHLNSYSRKSELSIVIRASDIEQFFNAMELEEIEALVIKCNREIAKRRG